MDNNKFLKELAKIRVYDDYPTPGVKFFDFNELVGYPLLLNQVVVRMTRSVWSVPSCIFAVESRGFILGSILARHYNVPLFLIRKERKLPGKVYSINTKSEYGEQTFEVQAKAIERAKASSQVALLVDDISATGGTLDSVAHFLLFKGVKTLKLVFADIQLGGVTKSDVLSVIKINEGTISL